MNTKPRNHETEVLQRLLAEAEPSREADHEHLDDETLALFAAGALTGAARDAAIQHLAACDHCRKVAAFLMEENEESSLALPPRKSTWFTPQVLGYALAASLLIGITGFFILPGILNRAGGRPDQVAHKPPVQPGDPDKVQPNLVRPPLETLAFASQTRLTDYGFGLDGRKLADFEMIKSFEALPAGKDIESLLKRGHLLLSAGNAKLAGEVFQEATEKFPQEPVAWLGAGLAAFVDKNLDAAEKSFRKALDLDPNNQSARVNLAITLEAKNDRNAALQEWKHLLSQKLTPADREKFEQHVKVLEKESNEK